MISDKSNLPFNFLFDKLTRQEVQNIILKKYALTNEIEKTDSLLDKLEFYINQHFSIVTFYSSSNSENLIVKSFNFDYRKIIFETFFEEHPLLNNQNYETFIQVVDALILNNSIFTRHLLELYQSLIILGNQKIIIELKNWIISDIDNVTLDQKLDIINSELLELKLNFNANKDIINLYSSLIDYFKTKKQIGNVKANKCILNPSPSHEQLKLESIFIHTYKSKSFLVTDFLINHNIICSKSKKWGTKNKGVASMLYKELTHNNLISCTQATFKNIFNVEYSFNGELKPEQFYKKLDKHFQKDLEMLINEIKK